MKRQTKTTSQEQQEQKSLQEAQAQQQTHPHEFATPEELLRHDAQQTPVPPSIGQRLQDSLNREALTARPPWWRRLFGRSNS